MADEAAIELIDVAKTYRLFASKRDRLKEALHPLRRIYHREFRALRDITLCIGRGRTVGIVGVNGSGKSTLLQIISGVLTPTSGTVAVRGRVAALLELGAGFNPDLTGRENVVTNALIMGLDRRGIEARLDRVEAFADIGVHFDQPVKTYSSGMFMRVAFAAAVHVDPDILIIDEALAVGDAKFQEKCFRRFKDFQQADKTILFVTHDRASVTQFCDEAILLHHGALVGVGEPRSIIDAYTELLTTGRTERWASPAADVVAVDGILAPALSMAGDVAGEFVADPSVADRCAANPLYNRNEHRFGAGGARVVDFLVTADGKVNPGILDCGTMIEVLIKIVFDEDMASPLVGMTLSNAQGVVVYGVHSGWLGQELPAARAGDVRVYRYSVRLSLATGAWFFELAVARRSGEVSDVRSKLFMIDVLRTSMLIGLVQLDAEFAVL
jgi:lipopolysaccharide transport system ATP-binding protein